MNAIGKSNTKKNGVLPTIKSSKAVSGKKLIWHKCDKSDRWTMLECALNLPLDLMWTIASQEREGEIHENALVQAQKLLDIQRRIRPPRKKPDEWEFIVRVGRNQDFKDFRIVRVGTSSLGTGEYRTEYLSIAPRDWYSSTGDARIMKKFNNEFFGGTPTFDQMVAFVLREENFDPCAISQFGL